VGKGIPSPLEKKGTVFKAKMAVIDFENRSDRLLGKKQS
jgi:hypothetical protein